MRLLLRISSVVVLALLTASCSQNLQQWLDAKDAEKAKSHGGYQAVIQLHGYPCEQETALRIVRNAYGDASYHVTCRCPATGQGQIMNLEAKTMRMIACRPGLQHYLVTYNPLAPMGSPSAFWVEPALP